jgi:hypothetical protein
MASPTILPLLSLDDGLSAFSNFVEGLRTAPATSAGPGADTDARLLAAETRIAVLESQLLDVQNKCKELLQQQAVQELTMKQAQQAHGSQLMDTVLKKCEETVKWTDKLTTERCEAVTHHVLAMVNDRLAEVDVLGLATAQDAADAARLAGQTEARLAEHVAEGGELLTGEALAALTASLAVQPAAPKRPADDTVSADKGLAAAVVEVSHMLAGKVEHAAAQVESAAESAADAVADQAEAAADKVEVVAHAVAVTVEDVVEAAVDQIEAVVDKIEDVVEAVVDKIEDVVEAAVDKIEDAVETLANAVEQRLEFTHDLDAESAEPTQAAEPEPEKAEQPAEPEQPEKPAEPEQPEQPAEPEQPEQPAEPAESEPAEPEKPEQPEQPAEPAESEPAKPEQPEQIV